MPDRNRDDVPFDAFVAQYERLLLWQARKWLALYPLQSVSADDVVQETLLRAFRYLDRQDGRIDAAKEKAWLLTIEKNVLRDLLRKDSRSVGLSPLDHLQADPATTDPDPANDAIDPLHWLAPHVADLPDHLGNVIRQGIDLGCWRPEVIGEAMGRTAGGVRSAICKIRAQLINSFGFGELIGTVQEYHPDANHIWLEDLVVQWCKAAQLDEKAYFWLDTADEFAGYWRSPQPIRFQMLALELDTISRTNAMYEASATGLLPTTEIHRELSRVCLDYGAIIGIINAATDEVYGPEAARNHIRRIDARRATIRERVESIERLLPPDFTRLADKP